MAIEIISGNTLNSQLPTKSVAKDAADVKQKTSVPVSTDTIDFTNTTQDVKSALAASAATPVVNEDRVAAIKAAVQSGSYKADVERVAEKMLQFEDKLPDST